MTSPTNDANQYLMGGGIPWAKFPAIGHTVTGRITAEPERRQQRDYDDPSIRLTWDDGTPRWEVVVNLATNERDPMIEDDDGTRALHVKGAMHPAVRDAVRASGADGLHRGGVISVTYTGDGVPKGRGKPPKLYSVRYTPPTGAANEALMAGAAGNGGAAGAAPQPQAPAPTRSAAPTPAPPAPPVPAPPPQPAPAPVPLPPPGVDPQMWARMAPAQRDAVLAAMAVPAGAAPPAPPF